MLSKKHRLAKTKDVQKTFVRGRSFFNPFFTVRYLKSENPDQRFTVVVSTKVSKKAVVRNRLKRVLREIIRLNLEKFLPGDYAVVVKPAAGKIDAAELRGSFLKLVSSARLYQSKQS